MEVLPANENLKSKFKQFFKHQKKMNALENFSECGPLQHQEFFDLIEKCMKKGFLGDKESEFLDYMVDKYFNKNNYLDWAHKTRWVKGQISFLQRAKNVLVPNLSAFLPLNTMKSYATNDGTTLNVRK